MWFVKALGKDWQGSLGASSTVVSIQTELHSFRQLLDTVVYKILLLF